MLIWCRSYQIKSQWHASSQWRWRLRWKFPAKLCMHVHYTMNPWHGATRNIAFIPVMEMVDHRSDAMENMFRSQFLWTKTWKHWTARFKCKFSVRSAHYSLELMSWVTWWVMTIRLLTGMCYKPNENSRADAWAGLGWFSDQEGLKKRSTFLSFGRQSKVRRLL